MISMSTRSGLSSRARHRILARRDRRRDRIAEMLQPRTDVTGDDVFILDDEYLADGMTGSPFEYVSMDAPRSDGASSLLRRGERDPKLGAV